MNDFIQYNDIYKNKVVLVTGHTGFKGSWLTLWLNQLGAKVIGFSLVPNTTPNLFELLELEDEITSIIGDIRNYDEILSVISQYNPEFVFHLAAQPLVRKSYIDPVETLETNIMGVVNILEVIRNTNSVKVFVNVTTDKCYENNETIYPYREIDSMGGYDPYSVSKGCSELITSSYRRSFFNSNKEKKLNVAISSARAGNVIGGGDWAEERLIPEIIESLHNDKIVYIRYPKATRPWQFVLESLSGYLMLGSKLYIDPDKYAEAWNFGPITSNYLTVEDIVNLLIETIGKGKWEPSQDENEKHEAGLLALDITKSMVILNWRPVLTTEQGIKWTVEWYKKHFDKSNMKEVTQNQLNEYCKLALEHNILWCKNK